jgi:hypothetical protein
MQKSHRVGEPSQTVVDFSPADLRCSSPKLKVGILAYGSLIPDPGLEIGAKIRMRVKTQSPFPVEYGRLSQTRGGAPTLVAHPQGAPVFGEILVLDDSVSNEEARGMLWRRERHRTGSGEKYLERSSPNSVLVRTYLDHPRVEIVHYTDFHPEGKIAHPSATELGKHAIKSVKKAEDGKDGITYLMNAMSAGIITPLTDRYVQEILTLTETASLHEALEAAKTIVLDQ